ncbi:hypothetical protein CEW89_13955 [Celeribacter ethanolicus]|uniref:Uncharacterized protein n=1 Tax=Celeribacter ethanolicus TaxID=1758178 RepID=A0A291GEX2_9RHOB|nr:hypothetical protein [Celeribacter ethanolicus]ATG48564.1 hypothetical protein CEW89_13955 [Celeribacter ethanolicus]
MTDEPPITPTFVDPPINNRSAPEMPAPEAEGEELPSLPASATMKCCPEASLFNQPLGHSSYYAYDDKTNLADPSSKIYEYWDTDGKGTLPDAGSLSAPEIPSIPTTTPRDGSAWVSVAVGKEATLDAKMLGTGCIPNVTYESKDSEIVKVVTEKPAAETSPCKIKGLAPGTTTIVAKCNGNEIGWVHVWCETQVTLKVKVASIVSEYSRPANYVLADLEAYINDVYRQFLISVSLDDLGAIEVKSPSSAYNNEIGNLLALDKLAVKSTPSARKQYRLFYYINNDGSPPKGLGIVPGGLGAVGPGYAFFDSDVRGAYNTMAHELGHLLDLSHPAHDFTQDNFPAWQQARYLDRNTGALSSSKNSNVLYDDAWNLMGYNGPVSARGSSRVDLRYMQWKKANRS